MNLEIILIYNFEKYYQQKQILQIPLGDNEPYSFTIKKQEIMKMKKRGSVVDVLTINIGAKICAKKETLNPKIEELILTRLISTLEYIKENSLIKSQTYFLIQVFHSTFPVISPLLNWIQDFKQLNELEIKSAQPFSKEQRELFMQILCEKFLQLKILHFDVAQIENSTNNTLQVKSKQESLEEIIFSEIKQVEELSILQSFSKIITLKLQFPLASRTSLIDQVIARAAQLIPQIKTLELKIENHSSYSLSEIQNFSCLKDIKIISKVPIKIDLSKLKELTSIHIESPDPLAVFCKQKRLESLKSLSLLNIGGSLTLKGSKNERKSIIQQYQMAVQQHANLNSLIFSSQGYNPSLLEFVKRDLEVFSVVVSQLKTLDVNLVPSNPVTRKDMDEELVTILCQILDKCKQEIRINYSFSTSHFSKKSICDMGLAIRRFSHSKLFSLNGSQIFSNFFKQDNVISVNSRDFFSFILSLGHLSQQCFNGKIFHFEEEYISTLKDYSNSQDKDIVEKIKQILYPFTKISMKKLDLSNLDSFSCDLTYIFIRNKINLKIIDRLIDIYPKLVQISTQCNEIENFTSYDESYFPKRIIELNIQMSSYSYEEICQLRKIQGHFVKVQLNDKQIYSLLETKQIIELIADSNEQILFFKKVPISEQKPGSMMISEYCSTNCQETTRLHAFKEILADFLPVNPLMAYLDLYF